MTELEETDIGRLEGGVPENNWQSQGLSAEKKEESLWHSRNRSARKNVKQD